MTTPVSVVGVYRKFPKELFRINKGPQIRLREYKLRHGNSFDVLANASGNIEPKALDPSTYAAPNGASMRPNSHAMRSITRQFTAPRIVVYSVPRGTTLPDNVILVHERKDHYSLQPAVEMSLDNLNRTITGFFATHAMQLTKEEWLAKYPTPTETS